MIALDIIICSAMNTVDYGSSIHTSSDPCLNDHDKYICKPCHDENKRTFANGWCKECEEYMCSTCFRHHCKSKFCKEHELLDAKPASAKHLCQSLDGLMKCQKHLNEFVKFYCVIHEVCGCAACMVLEHKTCEVEYIPEKAVSGEESVEFKTIVEDIEGYSSEIKSCISEISRNKKGSENTHESFVSEVHIFREAIVSHVNKIAAEICVKSTEMKTRNIQQYTELLEEAEEIETEIEAMTRSTETHKSQPNRLFVSMVDTKRSLKQMSCKILDLQERNIEETYCFQKNSELESILLNCDKIGQITNSSEMEQKQENDELYSGSDSLPENVVPGYKAKVSNLQDMVLRSEYMQLENDTLRYKGVDDLNGIYIADVRMTTESYFEVEILNDSKGGSVAIGLVPRNYPKQQFPGWKKDSIGYHSDDGRIFNESNSGAVIAPCGQFDIMGCRILYIGLLGVIVEFTKNGQKVGEKLLRTSKDMFPAIALDTKGQKVKVMIDGKGTMQDK